MNLAIFYYEPRRKLNGGVSVGSLEFVVYLMKLERKGSLWLPLRSVVIPAGQTFYFYELTSQ